MPVSIKYLLPIALLVVAVLAGRDAWIASRAFALLTGPSGSELAVDTVLVQLIEFDDAPNGVSPTPALGEPFEVSPGSFSLGAERVRTRVLCRLSAPGLGDSYGVLEPGGVESRLEIGPPRRVRGQVLGDDRTAVPDASVMVLGGGARGVLLAETTTDSGGWFEIDNVSVTVKAWGLRVQARGYALANRDWFPGSSDEPEPVVQLVPTAPSSGRLEALGANPPELGDLELGFFHVPGLSARTDAAGAFTVWHLPPAPTRAAVMLPGLPAEWTLRRTWLLAGRSDQTIGIGRAHRVSGRVMNGLTGRAAVDCVVYHEHGPLALESTRTDATGRFTLERVPEGAIEIHATQRVPLQDLPAEIREERSGRFVDCQAVVITTVIGGREPGEVFLELQ